MGCCIASAFTLLAQAVLIFQLIFKVIPWLLQNIAPKFLGPKVKVEEYGKWAVITGATEGIGKAYAQELAKKNLNLVLISRNLEKLENVAKEITKEHKVEVKVIAVDFKGGLEIYDKIASGIQDLEIGVLVNNIGISYDHPQYFLEIMENEPAFPDDLIKCNIHSVTYMTKLILPSMLSRKKGIIINVSSLSAWTPSPLISLYGASKAFVDKFSEDLHSEYRDQGIIVQSVLPGFVCSNMSKIRKPYLFAPLPDTYVISALNTLGHSRHTIGFIPHAFLALVISTVGSINMDYAASLVMQRTQTSRKKALKNKEKTN